VAIHHPQSSNIAINLTMQRTRTCRLPYTITRQFRPNNGLQISPKPSILHDRVTALGLYIESFGDIAAFENWQALARVRQNRLCV